MRDEPREAPTRPADAPPADADVHLQRISVTFEFPVAFTRGLFRGDNPLLASTLDRLGEGRRHRAVVYLDAGAAAADAGLIERIQQYFHERPRQMELAAPVQVLGGGEAVKHGWDAVRNVLWTIGNLHLDRQSFVLAVGGGALLDMVGFAASIAHRGLRLVRVPTTTLAQADAGVGVKTGMDEHGMKNFVGTFAPPFAVLSDLDFLELLPFEAWIGGAAEAFKVAILKDAAFFDFLCARAGDLRARSAPAMEHLVRRCAFLHLEHIRIGGDPFETGSARPLDFGHWSAHKLETLSGYRLGHGQAAAVGVALDSYYAMRKGLLAGEEFSRIAHGLMECGLPVWSPLLERRSPAGRLAVLEGLEEFRQHLGGELSVTLPRGIGGRVEVHHVDESLVEEGASRLKALEAERVA